MSIRSLFAVIPVIFCLISVPVSAQGQCDAYFALDGNLNDSSGSGMAGQMIGKEGIVATPQFVDGKNGQALKLDGTSAMRAFVDLHFDNCPQVTMTAWVMIDGRLPRSSQNIVSTGAGSGPGLRMSGSNLILNGTANGLRQSNAMRANSGWMFIAGVYDYEKGTYTLHWRDRKLPGELGEYRYPPEDALWIGALNDGLSGAAKDIIVDELRVYGRVLNQAELRAVQAGKQPGTEATQQVAALACSARDECGTGSYCAFDNTCHPESHLPLRDIELVLAPAPVQEIITVDRGGRGNDTMGPGMPQPIPGIGDRFEGDATGIDAISRPERVPVLVGDADNNGNVNPKLKLPPATDDPGLTPMGDLPGGEIPSEFGADSYRPPPPQVQRYDLEVYRVDSDGPLSTIDIVLPGTSEPQTITYENVNGVAVAEGDIILGDVSELDEWQDAVQSEARSGGLRTRQQGLNVIKNTKFLWPNGKIPYTFHANMTADSSNLAKAAASKLTSLTNLTVVPRAGEDNYVEFKMKDNDFDACSSRVGMKQSKGSQTIKVDPECGESTLIHEILHAAGFWHEQSRPDRDQYVEILRDNVIAKKRHNFNKKNDNQAAGVGPYNYKSVMHYGEFNFGKECIRIGASDPNCVVIAPGETRARTLRVKQPGAVIARDLSTDVDAINAVYPNRISHRQGLNWADGFYATATAVGDIDGDGRNEIIVGRVAQTFSRFIVYDDKSGQHRILTTGPSDWGADVAVTDLSVGDIDGDGTMEIGVTRKSGSGNRFYIYKYNNGQLAQVFQGGDDWGAGNYATSIAFGDVDGDGRDEIAVGRKAGEFGRYYLFNDGAAAKPYERLAIGGSNWDATHYATDVAFGDVDNDNRLELGITRFANSGMRYEVVSYSNGNFTQVHSGGHDWGSGHYGTAIAFGNVDNDDGDELLVGRKAGSDSRFYVDDDQSGSFSRLDSGGDLWGSNYYVVGVDLADVDSDGKDEIIVARNAGENGRYYVYNYFLKSFRQIPVKGAPLLGGVGATGIAAGDVDNDGKADLVVAYDEKVRGRMRYEIIYLNPPGS